MTNDVQPIFETERLVVKHFVSADLDDFAKLCADPEVLRYVGDGTTLTRDEVAHWIDVCQTKYETRGYGTSAVFEKDKATESFVGYCGVVRAPEEDFDQLIYVFHKRAWGKGYAKEAGQAMLEYVFARSTLPHIYATIDSDNLASQKVAAKLGMNLEKEELEDGSRVYFYVVERPPL